VGASFLTGYLLGMDRGLNFNENSFYPFLTWKRLKNIVLTKIISTPFYLEKIWKHNFNENSFNTVCLRFTVEVYVKHVVTRIVFV
jgi:hypothetical protein